MDINIRIPNKYFYLILSVIIILILGLGVFAFGTGNPQKFGHSISEIAFTDEIPTLKTATLETSNILFKDKNTPGETWEILEDGDKDLDFMYALEGETSVGAKTKLKISENGNLVIKGDADVQRAFVTKLFFSHPTNTPLWEIREDSKTSLSFRIDKSLLVIKKDGRVGIGTSDPDQMLDVRGNVKITENLVVNGKISGNPDTTSQFSTGNVDNGKTKNVNMISTSKGICFLTLVRVDGNEGSCSIVIESGKSILRGVSGSNKRTICKARCFGKP
mgnify:CR=1 FL=1